MLIAERKKEENIAEYIIYIWQLEDILRANKLDLDNIQRLIIDQYQVDETTKGKMREWYDNLIQMMKLEHVEEKGHLQFIKNTVDDLNDLHMELLQKPKEIQYNALFFKTLPFLVEFRKKVGAGEEMNDVELSLQALYEILLLRLQKKEITDDTAIAVKQISQLMAVLAQKYKTWLNEEPEDEVME